MIWVIRRMAGYTPYGGLYAVWRVIHRVTGCTPCDGVHALGEHETKV
jgi:hypothetical protein